MKEKKPLGTLFSVNLRECWEQEDEDFTPWLAKPENLNLLGEAIDMMDLELVGREHPVGKYSADILARRTDSEEEHLVVIENQLDKTNHKHLGQLLTYASGLKAKALVWVAKKMEDEHKKALDWLNENSSSDIAFFGLEMELWRIGDSLLAPKFNVVSQPNGWARTIQKTSSRNPALDKNRLEFWTEFVEYMRRKGTLLRLKSPTSEHLYGFGIGHAGFRIRLTTNSTAKCLGCELRITHEKRDHFFNAFKQEKELIQKELNVSPDELNWNDTPEGSNVIVQYREGDFQNREEWPQLFAWFKERAEAFYKTFSKQIQDMDRTPTPNRPRSEEAA